MVKGQAPAVNAGEQTTGINSLNFFPPFNLLMNFLTEAEARGPRSPLVQVIPVNLQGGEQGWSRGCGVKAGSSLTRDCS